MAFAMRRAAHLTTDDVDAGVEADDVLAHVLAAQHDVQAFTPLYARYQPVVNHYCLRRLS